MSLLLILGASFLPDPTFKQRGRIRFSIKDSPLSWVSKAWMLALPWWVSSVSCKRCSRVYAFPRTRTYKINNYNISGKKYLPNLDLSNLTKNTIRRAIFNENLLCVKWFLYASNDFFLPKAWFVKSPNIICHYIEKLFILFCRYSRSTLISPFFQYFELVWFKKCTFSIKLISKWKFLSYWNEFYLVIWRIANLVKIVILRFNEWWFDVSLIL